MLSLITPLLLPLVASGVANLAGCQVHEGGPSPCLILGMEFGELFAFLAVLPWLSFATLPIAAVVIVAWFIAETVCRLARMG